MTNPPLSLVLASRLESLERLEGFIAEVLKRNCLDDDMRGNVMISTLEAVTNAIRHGNRLDAGKTVRVEIIQAPTRLEVIVKDQGAGFAPDAVQDPTEPDYLEVEGGRGVFLMRALTDRIDFEDDGRAVRMGFSCRCASVCEGSYMDVAAA